MVEGTFLNVDKSTWIYQPQLVRWRHAFRSPRNSLRINQELSQTRFDLAYLLKSNIDLTKEIIRKTDSLIEGDTLTDIQVSSDGIVTPDVFVFDGLLDLVSRVDGLRKRVALLEEG